MATRRQLHRLERSFCPGGFFPKQHANSLLPHAGVEVLSGGIQIFGGSDAYCKVERSGWLAPLTKQELLRVFPAFLRVEIIQDFGRQEPRLQTVAERQKLTGAAEDRRLTATWLRGCCTPPPPDMYSNETSRAAKRHHEHPSVSRLVAGELVGWEWGIFALHMSSNKQRQKPDQLRPVAGTYHALQQLLAMVHAHSSLRQANTRI